MTTDQADEVDEAALCDDDVIADLTAERDELREALRASLERSFYGDECNICGGTWEKHQEVRAYLAEAAIPCPVAKQCALLSRHPSQPVKETHGG